MFRVTGTMAKEISGEVEEHSRGALLVLHDHENTVIDVSPSASGRRALLASDDDIVRAWNAATDSLLRTMTGHEKSVFAVSLSADGRRALSGGRDETVRVWGLPAADP